jgi:hypothetical protein
MQRLANPRVGAGHGYRDPGPVANVTPCGGERLDRDRVGTVEHARQVADHTTGPVGHSMNLLRGSVTSRAVVRMVALKGV